MITDGNPIKSVNRADKRRPPPPPRPPRHLRGLRTLLLDRPSSVAPRPPPLTPARPRESLQGDGAGSPLSAACPASWCSLYPFPSTVPSVTISSSWSLSLSFSVSALVSVPSPSLVSVPILLAVSSSARLPPPSSLALFPARGVFSCQLLLCTEAVAEVVV